jgi:hypothetical protein
MPTNQWEIGALYNGGYQNGVAGYWTQPGGVGTQVFPTQQNAQPWVEYPIAGLFINEFIPWWSPPCLHSDKFLQIIREFDYTLNQSCALVCCSLCSFVIYSVSPYEEILNPIERAIIVG